ncbi:hypothetical protein BD309DRAFT_946883 [Dichomitus squalens]|uniref:DUF7726 domain-containing protein n=1 Tax=Dichomitus squalens TaxID=114155 RepID=A0A4Q9P5A8_9APHY|nr:uncharacterized protein DICSQDRAFT_164430 [Dichomitus squalens LYAD-421 SS1]EJF66589.1 hypothetical protein DICSQDRAFT_164430 [Dichomitus squalens LYAD-421 SS1]TBU35122.1 hypothetical protein BD311DRAFT_709296 [Dichomitus squalens]TBU49639.1 hypothetical protein BD309DRAFT_946883 [Dichomitus squalens]TBU64944.1 hypothetical protein BD310DRAFT_838566 [Dichomitus squalens]
MSTKRKSDVLEPVDLTVDTSNASGGKENAFEASVAAPAVKKARTSDAGEGSSSGTKKGKKADAQPPKNWYEVVLDGEDEGEVPIYDDCNDIRRKIRALQKEPGFKITKWLESIGNINNNSYQRFMKATGPTGGAGNGTYYAAYVYFEKRRIAEGKKKTAKRIRTEEEHPMGLPREDRKNVWVFMPR